jgi:hypothetical protein
VELTDELIKLAKAPRNKKDLEFLEIVVKEVSRSNALLRFRLDDKVVSADRLRARFEELRSVMSSPVQIRRTPRVSRTAAVKTAAPVCASHFGL